MLKGRKKDSTEKINLLYFLEEGMAQKTWNLKVNLPCLTLGFQI